MKRWLTLSILTGVLVLSGCEETAEHADTTPIVDDSGTEHMDDADDLHGEPMESIDESGEPSGEPVESADEPAEPDDADNVAESAEDEQDHDGTYSLDHMDLPSADDLPLGEDYIELNNNIPIFTNDELEQVEPFFSFAALDDLGRIGVANALLDEELMPPEQTARGSLSHVTPTGWNQNDRGDAVSDIVSGGWLYNRSHLIGHQMAGSDTDVAENLMAGARQFNENMLLFENFVADVVEQGTQVRYRVTPVFDGDNLLSHGVVMEGFSLDDTGDLGDALTFNVFVPNEQDGITFDYRDGSWDVDGTVGDNAPAPDGAQVPDTEPSDTSSSDDPPAPSDTPVSNADSDSALQLINEGSSEALQAVKGIGPAYAERIIDYRETNGAFPTLGAITNVSGIDDVVYEELKQNH